MINYVYKDKVLIEIKDESSEEEDYILPQDMDAEEILSGKVVAVGVNAEDTKVGDIVVFGQYDYSKTKIEGVEYILTKEENLICKLGEDE